MMMKRRKCKKELLLQTAFGNSDALGYYFKFFSLRFTHLRRSQSINVLEDDKKTGFVKKILGISFNIVGFIIQNKKIFS